ncbi:hypothetical protein MKK70_13190 [Methylobacterium sp. E-041]|uniref:hypothetical protein n=2 Tax=Methylobacterium TaxID=407 RepID=UPI0011CB8B28|nr:MULTISPECIES: hypothetical protein [unclassified Methylobacterium]MCJ2078452.1 hypothetical protein [Methylobacterium sp. E-016]MCJ2106318.1 hypothetical protein [Methylobacterium sp. E-041]MCJ2112492.1 hypothetical protein [Methylobacterium sp. E-025]TXN66848.1 hypothetical protein FV232_13960 [Methylobacterium sp. WL30]
MWRPDWRVCRAVIAVTALYALALQAVLGGMTGVRTLDPAHALCLQESGADGQGPADAPHHGDHLACCTAAQAMPMADVPVPAAVAVARSAPPAVDVPWRPVLAAAARAPPGIGAGARAPPAA